MLSNTIWKFQVFLFKIKQTISVIRLMYHEGDISKPKEFIEEFKIMINSIWN